jgi:MFS family permease
MSATNNSPAQGLDQKIQPKQSAFSVLRHRDYSLLWVGQLVSVTGSQMQVQAINWHVYLLTNSKIALGVIGLVRVLPIVLCSLLGGVAADVFDRKHLMLVTQSVMLVSAGLLAAITFHGLTSVWPIYLLTATASAAVAFDAPARQALMPMLVPRAEFPNAVSLSLVVFQMATVMGPALGGLVLGGKGPGMVYALNAASFVMVIFALLLMKTSGKPATDGEKSPEVSVSALREGLRFVWRTPIIVQTMTLDFVATFFASATALLPVFASDILRVGAQGFGLLGSAPAIGSVITALIMARIGTIRRQGITVLISVAVYGLTTMAFGLSRWFLFSVIMLALMGSADTVSTVLRQTIRQLVTPDYLRGRMTSINMVFFMGGPQLGELEAGVLASIIGAPLSVITGGLGCVIAVLIAALSAKTLMSYKSKY